MPDEGRFDLGKSPEKKEALRLAIGDGDGRFIAHGGGQLLDLAERLAERGQRLLEAVALHASVGEPAQVGHASHGFSRSRVVVAEPPGGVVEPIDAEALERPANRAVQDSSARREEPFVDDLADPVVREVETVIETLTPTVTSAAQDMHPHEPFEGCDEITVVEGARGLQQIELELAADDGSRGHDLLAKGWKARDMRGDELPDPGRHRQVADTVAEDALLEGA